MSQGKCHFQNICESSIFGAVDLVFGSFTEIFAYLVKSFKIWVKFGKIFSFLIFVEVYSQLGPV